MSIRTRRVTDLDKCVDALRTVHDADAYPLNWPADPRGWLTPPRLLQAWIAEEPDGAVAGHVAVQRLPDAAARHAELSRLYVTPAARRRSVASALVRHARSWAAQHGYDLTLNVADEHRSAAVAFYDATGWQQSHTADADWTSPDGRPVRLRHYVLNSRDAELVIDESRIDQQRRDPIKIVPYDSNWPVAFERQRLRVESALRPWLVGPVEHIGSTSVPGLAAKPIIDMLARIPDYDTGDIDVAMSSIGWTHAPEPGDERSRKWSFCFPDIGWRTHHLHIFETASEHWPSLLTFRDHLRNHPEDAAEYGRIKKALAAADTQDRPRYRAGKAPFIEELLHRLTLSGDQTRDE